MTNLLKDLISEFENREQKGFLKYGTTMDRSDLTLNEWLQHALEEAMDLCVYLTKIKQQLNDTQRFPDYQEADSRFSESINSGGEASDARTSL